MAGRAEGIDSGVTVTLIPEQSSLEIPHTNTFFFFFLFLLFRLSYFKRGFHFSPDSLISWEKQV